MRVALVLHGRFVLDLQFGCDLVIPFEILVPSIWAHDLWGNGRSGPF